MRSTPWLAATAAAVLLALAGCSGSDDPAETETPTAEESAAQDDAAPQAPEPDLDGVPDVVAEVDGVPITREEFVPAYERQLSRAFQQAQMTGTELDQATLRQETADGLVDTQLLLAEAEARSIEATPEDVEAAAQDIATSYGMASAEEFYTALEEEEGMAREEAEAQVQRQTTLELLFTDEAGEYTPSQEEVQELYDTAVAQAEGAEGGGAGEIPPLEEVQPQIEEQLRQQHRSEAVVALLEQLRADADIVVHLENVS